MDWQRRLLEIGLAGGLASGALACGQQPCINCGCEQKTLSTSIDTAAGGPTGPTVWEGCPVPESSPPAAYGPTPNSGGTCPEPTRSAPFVYQSVATDDDSLGYTAADVLNAINNSKVGDLLWMDGTRTKLRFSARQAVFTPTPSSAPVSVYDPPPGACYRSLAIDFIATLTSDDGRLNETLGGSVTTYDEGGLFDINHLIIQMGSFGDGSPEPVLTDAAVAPDAGNTTDGGNTSDAGNTSPPGSSVGTIRSVIPPLLGLNAGMSVTFSMRFVVKGATCSYYYCEPGAMPPDNGCFPPSGVISISGLDPVGPRGTCVFANVASWRWE